MSNETPKTAASVYQEVLGAISECLEHGDYEGAASLSGTAVNLYNIIVTEQAIAEESNAS